VRGLRPDPLFREPWKYVDVDVAGAGTKALR
jgi:hypothetical protein